MNYRLCHHRFTVSSRLLDAIPLRVRKLECATRQHSEICSICLQGGHLFVCVCVCTCVCVCGFACVCLAYVSKYKQTENTYGKINAHINKKDIVRKTRCARMFIYGLSTPPACDTPSPPEYPPYYTFSRFSSYSHASAADKAMTKKEGAKGRELGRELEGRGRAY